VGEYSRLNDELVSDDVAVCLARWFADSCSGVTKQWIVTALLKLMPHLGNLSVVLETLGENMFESESREVLQV